MTETRSRTQIEANKLDLDLFRVAATAEQYGYHTVAFAIRRERQVVRAKMHPADREATS